MKIAISIITCLAVGFLSGMATAEAIPNWYAALNKPLFNPPNWLFAPVWTVLYIMMGVAAGMVWGKGWDNKTIRAALIFFLAQLVLNGAWTLVFFGLKEILLALVVIVVLWILIFICIRRFLAIEKITGYLLIPYLLWVSFATLLNGSIWWLN